MTNNRTLSIRTAFKAATAATVATVVATLGLVNTVSAHGSIVDPPSRNYGCWARWGSDFQNPIMQTEDPMCWQAWQHNSNAMWNWNGLYREGLAGNHQGGIPDGTLCSGGHAESGRYDSLDAVGAWRTVPIANSFRVKLWDQASHGADYIRVYVTRQGFNALTQPLRWADLELVGQIGNTPASQWTPEPAGGVSIQVPGNAPGRTGRHIVYTIWQASHSDQSYYLCSDVTFGGGGPTNSPSVPVSPSPSASQSPSASPTPSPSNPGQRACTATYRIMNPWPGGFQAEVVVTAGTAPISSWTVLWTFSSGQTISQLWNATPVGAAPNVSIRNASWNGSLGAGESTTFGFLGTWNGNNPVPAVTCTAT